MREPTLAEGAIFSPGHCHICGRAEGTMIDTMVDVPGDGRTYICTMTCLPLIANLAGFLSPEQADDLAGRVAEAVTTIAQLEEELAFERANKLMTVSDALKLAERSSSTPVKTAA